MLVILKDTIREFISPVLVGALKVVSFGDAKLSMVCEKRIIGKRAHGPVDYSFLFDCLDLVLTEAKREDVELGMVHNLLQLRACQEFLANTLIAQDLIQDQQKRAFAEAFADVARTPTCGITSTGGKWVLEPQQVEMAPTYVFLISLSHASPSSCSLKQTHSQPMRRSPQKGVGE